MWLWFIIALASLLALFLLALSVPLELAFQLDAHGRPRLSLRLVWLFGLLSREMRRKKPETKREALETRRKPRKRRGVISFVRVLRTRGLLKQIKRLVIDIFKRLRIKHLRADFRVGFDDPAYTGLLFAIIKPTLVFVSPPIRRNISITPSFYEPVLEGYLEGAVRLQPIRLLVPMLRFCLSPAFFRVTRMLVWERRRR